MSTPRATPLARPVDLRRYRTAGEGDVIGRFHRAYAESLRRLPRGTDTIRGLPFDLGPTSGRRRWLVVDRPIVIDLRAEEPASHIVIAHFCDAWRDPERGRPSDLPIGWVEPVGQPLGRYSLELASGRTVDATIRRRFEVNEGIVGWGQGAFAAVAHLTDQPLDWRGPYSAPAPARYVDAGLAGLLAIIPGSWGPAQFGVADSVPSPSNDIVLWLYEIAVPGGPAPLSQLRMEPLASMEGGGGIVIAAITTCHTRRSPLSVAPRRSLRISRATRGRGAAPPAGPAPSVSVDLGQIFRQRPGPHSPGPGSWPRGSTIGWGSPRLGPTNGDTVVDLAIAEDATIAVDSAVVPVARLPADGRRRRFGHVTIQSLPMPVRRIEVEVVDAVTRQPMPARVHFHAADGRYLPPLGHRDEINPGLNEDTGADVLLGDTSYAYVPGSFPIDLPASRVYVEAARGFGYRPLRRAIDVEDLDGRLVLSLEPIPRPAGGDWVAVDCHVHFISPTSALLQARAEGVAIVNLLATQWGDHHTSVADVPAGVVADASGEHLVVMGSENRQNMLGHIGLLGTPSPVLPMASAGAPEGRLGDPLDRLMADWADAARAQRGLAIAVHFPLPYAEVAADIVSGRIDAVEMQALTPDVDGPPIREWYRFLNCGYRLPVVGGTDKLSAEVPVGAIRTYARLERDRPVSFAAWADAVRAGRTFVSSGSFVELAVDGCQAGDVVEIGRGGRTVEVQATGYAALPVVDRLELIHDGVVVAVTSAGSATDRLELSERIPVSKSGWLAARVTSRVEIPSAFATGMGAHSSPVYLEVPGRPTFAPTDAAAIATIIDGARTWVDRIATVRSPAERERLASYFDASRRRLDERVRERS